VEFEWKGSPPALQTPLYAFARIDQGSGDPGQTGTTVLERIGPVTYDGSSTRLDFPQVPNGKGLVFVVELRQASSSTSPVLYDGVSAPFSVEPGVRRTIVVPMVPLVSAPATAAPGVVTYVRVPWGSKATGGSSMFSVVGTAGAASGAQEVLVYDGPDPATSDQIGRAPVDATGAFQAVLTPHDRPVVYTAAVDAAGNTSAAAAVHDVSWTAAFNGKVAGDTVINPHSILQEPNATFRTATAGLLQPGVVAAGLLKPGTSGAIEPADYAFAGSPGGAPLLTAAEPSWAELQGAQTTPTARWMHSLVYDSTRGRTILFDGSGFSGSINDLWEWDGQSWAARVAVGPPYRSSYGMAYDSGRGVTTVFGGCCTTSAQAAFGDTWEWDGTGWTQHTPASAPPPRSSFGMTYDASRRVSIIFGGETPQKGGGCNVPEGEGFYCCNDTWEWDGTNWTDVTPSSGGPSARLGQAMAYDATRGVTLLYGGIDCRSATYQDDTWEWTGTGWTRLQVSGPPARANTALAHDPVRGVLVLFGGDAPAMSAACPATDGYSGFVCDDTWEWDGTAWSDRSSSSAMTPAARNLHGMTYDLVRQEMVLFGGDGVMSVGCSLPDSHGDAFCDDTWEWDGVNWIGVAPTMAGSPPSARSVTAMTFDSTRNVQVLFGGKSSSSSPGCAVETRAGSGDYNCNDTWEWTGTSWTEVTPGSNPSVRHSHALAFDSSRSRTVLFGGCCDSSSNYFGDVWEWDGSAWTSAATSVPGATPTPRIGMGMAYDTDLGATVLFSGDVVSAEDSCSTPDASGGFVCNDMWSWDGESWTNLSDSQTGSSPPPRYVTAMTYDSNRRVLVLFGGISGNSLGDCTVSDHFGGEICAGTWEWGTQGWRNVSPSDGPPARYGHSLSYDSVRGVSILFGGYDGFGNVLNDTWEWDGSSWTQVLPLTNPPIRDEFPMSYDSATHATMIFGGLGAAGTGAYLPDTWFLSSNAGSFPTDLVHFDFGSIGEEIPPVSVQQISVAATAGGLGHAGSSSQPSGPVPGVALAAWDTRTGGNWSVLSTSSADTASPLPISYVTKSSWEASRYLQAGPAPAVDIAFSPVASNGSGLPPGALALGAPEVTVAYTHTEEPCPEHSCTCAQDETACGSVCADLNLDPQNCGQCGRRCSPDMTCTAGNCSCPAGETACMVCTDLQQDPLNCGGCGKSCAAGQVCRAGTCGR
jgi:hypothetical protein